MRDVPWEDTFKLTTSAAASEFYEGVQVGIDVFGGQWPSEFQNQVQNPLGAQLGLGTQPCYKVQGNLQVKHVRHSD